MGDNNPNGCGDHGHGYAVQQPVHVATGQINHNVALENEKMLMVGFRKFSKRLTQTTGRLTRVYRATKMIKTVYGGWSSVQRRTAWM